MTEARIVLDVWGGPQSLDHVARYLPRPEECWAIAAAELAAGFLVNLRQEIAWGCFTPFDRRTGVLPVAGELQ
ncbi:hypothetical protein [Novosphingobium kaempferiae]|uniref:hypothetical protein n=1 Tax=Novosphingobium kaempferiae TaxID=2896849 RepID=UPI001E2B7F2C|nr:hypothetical protein [Novosphingobium kaempferiae]